MKSIMKIIYAKYKSNLCENMHVQYEYSSKKFLRPKKYYFILILTVNVSYKCYLHIFQYFSKLDNVFKETLCI